MCQQQGSQETVLVPVGGREVNTIFQKGNPLVGEPRDKDADMDGVLFFFLVVLVVETQFYDFFVRLGL